MRIAVMSDIHANIEAFAAVLADLDTQRPDDTINLGDVIGYGPNPEEAMAMLRARGIASVVGNHEQGVVDDKARAWFNPVSRKAVDITDTLISDATRAFIRDMPQYILRHGCRFVHGCPPQATRLYLHQATDAALARIFHRIAERITFVGHTHDLELISWDGETITHTPIEAPAAAARQTVLTLEPDQHHIVNVGAVGQPRDGDSRAKYVLWEPGARRLTVRFVPYDYRATARKILALGIPETFAHRLGA
ncbi:MAG: metallophosphoesterase [Desulfovibrionaceae bacterium]